MLLRLCLLAAFGAAGCMAASLPAASTSTCSTRSLIYYTSGTSTFTVASCAPSTVYITPQSTCPSPLSSIAPSITPQDASAPPSTIYITQPATCPTSLEGVTAYVPTTIYVTQQGGQAKGLSLCASSPGGASSPFNCLDTYGNAFNVSYGTQYLGSISQRMATSDIDSCLLNCDQMLGCVAADYMNGTCSLLNSITGTESVPFGSAGRVAGAIRPPDVSTVYSTPPGTSAAQSLTQEALATSKTVKIEHLSDSMLTSRSDCDRILHPFQSGTGLSTELNRH